MGLPPAPPAPPGAVSTSHSTIMELDRAVQQEKSALVEKLRSQIQDSAAKPKWTSFCQVHGHGKTDVNHHDMAFLTTFLESYEAGTIITLDDHDMGAADAGEGGASSNKIFVGGLPKGTDENKLWSFFGQWGRVEKVDCKKDENGQPRGFAFVTFQDAAHAQQVVDNKDGNKLDGKWIDCKIAEGVNKGGGGKDKGGKDAGKGGKDAGKGGGGGGGSPSDGSKIFIGGLPRTATEQTLSAYFSYFGVVEKVDLKMDPQGTPRGFGFIIFSSPESVSKALAKPSVEFEGKWIECKAVTSSKGDSKGGDGKSGDKGKDSGKDSGKGGKDSGKDSWSGGGGSDWKSGNDWKSSDSGKWESKDDQGGGGSWSNSGGGGDKWGGSDKKEAGNDGSWGRGGGGDDKNAGGSGGSWSGGGGGSWSGGGGGGGSGDSAAKEGAGASSGANWNQNGNGRDAGYGAAEGGDAGSRWGPY